MIKTFTHAVKFVEGYIPKKVEKHPGKAGLVRMKYLVELLGNPQFKYPTIHVGGTSGKGSTATIIAEILATKYKVGLHTSPHLEKITERIKIITENREQRTENRDISEEEFVRLTNEAIPAIKKVEKSKYGRPSYFEITTALVFLAFAKEKVDMAVIEVGMGGRYDATNVIKPRIVVLTNVGLEHTDVLGKTIEEIAEDKAGIIKKGVVVVSGVKQKPVVKILESRIKNQESRLSLLSRDFDYEIKTIRQNGSTFDYFGEKTYRNLKLSLLGRHQVENAALAIKTVDKLRKLEIKKLRDQLTTYNLQLTTKDIREGLRSAFIPGRLEIVKKHPLVVLDGAHNTDKMKALVTAIKEIFPGKKITAVLAIKKGKDAGKMLFLLLPICQKVVLTKFSLKTDLGETFSYEPEELVEFIKATPCDSTRGGLEISIVGNSPQAVDEAFESTSLTDLILITGSLYLVGEVKRQVQNAKCSLKLKILKKSKKSL